MWTRGLVIVHAGQQMGRRRRVVLCGCHLVHKIRRVDRLVLLRLRVEYMRIKRLAKVGRQRLVLPEVVGLEEAVEVGVARGRNVERVGRDVVAALGAELWGIVLRDVLRSVQKAGVGKGILLGELLTLSRGKVLGVVQPRVGDGV